MSTLSQARSAIAQQKLTITYQPTAGLRLPDRSLRRHPKPQIDKLAANIGAFGFNIPVLIDPENNLISGVARVLAARELGLPEIPTICISHLSQVQIKAFTIADNRLAELSTWDDQVLADALRTLTVEAPDFSVELTGFDMGEIDFRIEAAKEPEPKTDRADVVPEQPDGPARSVLGDVWQLDGHRVLCGSALDADSYASLMDGQLAAMVFTDPPYNVKIAGHVSGLGTVTHREFAMATGEMTEAQFTAFLHGSMALLAEHSRDGSLHMLCMDWRHISELMEAAKPIYSELKNLCVWAKDNGGMGSLYRSQHELIFVYKRGTAKHVNNVELGRHGRNRTNVWKYAGVNSFARNGQEGNLLTLHPTVKPVKLVSDAILDCTGRGDIVLDAFLGSGSTLIAAEQVGRRCFGMDLDPLYVDTAVRRWQAATGREARHAVTGITFNDSNPLPEGSEAPSAQPGEPALSETMAKPSKRKGAHR